MAGAAWPESTLRRRWRRTPMQRKRSRAYARQRIYGHLNYENCRAWVGHDLYFVARRRFGTLLWIKHSGVRVFQERSFGLGTAARAKPYFAELEARLRLEVAARRAGRRVLPDQTSQWFIEHDVAEEAQRLSDMEWMEELL